MLPELTTYRYAEYSLLADYCVLHVDEAARLEVYSEWPKCREHFHVPRREALQMITDETHRLVGGVDTKVAHPVSMIVPVAIRNAWQPVPTSKLMGMRVWGLAPQR